MGKKKKQQQEPKKVLIVDDDEDILVAMESVLSQIEGIELERATNGNQAVDKIDKLLPDIVVLDVMLPKKSGFLVMEKIRQKRAKNQSNKPKVIMITGNPGQRHKEYAQTLGVDEYLNKPFRMDRFVEKVKSFLDED